MKLFGENNHSKYEIEWEMIDEHRSIEIQELILRNYNVDGVEEHIMQVKEWERMSNNFKVCVQVQGIQKTVLFRKNIRLNEEGSVAMCNKIVDFLQQRGVLVPVLVSTKQGGAFFQAGQHFYEMHDFISGNHFRGTKEELKQVGEGIAQLHKALEKIPFQEEIIARGKALSPWTVDVWNDIFRQADKREDDIDIMVMQNKEFIEGQIQKIQEAESRMKKLTKQIIHADLHPQNTLFEKEQLVGILDFEGAREGELTRDAGNACHRFARQFVVYQGKGYKETLQEGITIFLDSYEKVHPIQDKSAIPALVTDELLRKLQSDIGAHYIKQDSSKVEGGELEKKLTLLKESEILSNFIQ
jgi:Ser/Thr protein kinase RdoA (MazF antagonist)